MAKKFYEMDFPKDPEKRRSTIKKDRVLKCNQHRINFLQGQRDVLMREVISIDAEVRKLTNELKEVLKKGDSNGES